MIPPGAGNAFILVSRASIAPSNASSFANILEYKGFIGSGSLLIYSIRVLRKRSSVAFDATNVGGKGIGVLANVSIAVFLAACNARYIVEISSIILSTAFILVSTCVCIEVNAAAILGPASSGFPVRYAVFAS